MMVNRSINRLTNVFLALFMLLSISVVYWQVFDAKTLITTIYTPNLCAIGNQPVRGSIYDRNGVLLAYSQQDPNAPCNYRRYYCFPSLSPIIGYFSYIYGESGLEEAYDNYLSGADATGQNALNNFVNQTLHHPVYGDDVYLTIDARVQNLIDKEYDITYDEPGGNFAVDPIRHVAQGNFNPPAEPIPALCQQKDGSLLQQLYNQPDENAPDNHPGSVIVEDPHTGEILGMLSRPYFNANEIGDYTVCLSYTNVTDPKNPNAKPCPGAKALPAGAQPGKNGQPPVTSTIGGAYFQQLNADPNLPELLRPTSLYIPGSTFKTVTLSAALDSGKYQLTTPFGGNNCLDPNSEAQSYTVNGFNINEAGDRYLREYNPLPSCPIDLEHGYIYSDNVIYARVGVGIGVDTWLNYFQRFGMIDSNAQNKQPFPFDFPVKASRVDFQAARDDAASLAQDAFGQGTLEISPLEMAFVTSTVANNGVGLLPHLLYKVVPHGVDPNSVSPVAKTPYTGNGVSNGQIISPTTAQEVRESMRGVVTTGSGGIIGGSPANVGGKTGTAQLGGDEDPHSWFISLAPDGPGQTPQYVIVVMREHGDEGLFQAPVVDCIYRGMFNLPPSRTGNRYPGYNCA